MCERVCVCCLTSVICFCLAFLSSPMSLPSAASLRMSLQASLSCEHKGVRFNNLLPVVKKLIATMIYET